MPISGRTSPEPSCPRDLRELDNAPIRAEVELGLQNGLPLTQGKVASSPRVARIDPIATFKAVRAVVALFKQLRSKGPPFTDTKPPGSEQNRDG
jgi:hypothetical protein